MDKPKFGGPGKKKKPCIQRKCSQLAAQSMSVHRTVSWPDSDLPTNRKPLSEISNRAGQGIMQIMLNQ